MATQNLSIGLALFAGILTVVSPCILPVLPIIWGDRFRLTELDRYY